MHVLLSCHTADGDDRATVSEPTGYRCIFGSGQTRHACHGWRRLHATLAPGVQQARLFRHPGTAITQFAPHLAKYQRLT
jgi:hypothetical protein